MKDLYKLAVKFEKISQDFSPKQEEKLQTDIPFGPPAPPPLSDSNLPSKVPFAPFPTDTSTSSVLKSIQPKNDSSALKLQKIQVSLNKLHYPGPLPATGRFDANTKSAIEWFEKTYLGSMPTTSLNQLLKNVLEEVKKKEAGPSAHEMATHPMWSKK